jgi:hypothetical protein
MKPSGRVFSPKLVIASFNSIYLPTSYGAVIRLCYQHRTVSAEYDMLDNASIILQSDEFLS